MDIDLNPPETETQEAVRLQGKHMETVEYGIALKDISHLSERFGRSLFSRFLRSWLVGERIWYNQICNYMKL